MDKKVLDYFHGDELASSVWERKYRLDGENTPEDSFKRYCNEIADKEIMRINQMNREIIWDDLSDYGQERWQSMLGYNREAFMNHFMKLINFDNIILGGSMLATIGNKEAYSSLSNCFVLGQPYDSYTGINHKTMEICAVMTRRGGCVEENTKVIIRGENGQRIIKKIKDVKIGDYILSFNLKTHKDEWKRVNNHYIVDVPQDKQIVYKYENGTILKTSAYHPVLVIKDNQYNFASYEPKPEIHDMYNGGSKNLGNKSLNKEFIKPVWDESLSNIGWLIGAHMGDGTSDIVRNECNNEAQRIRFSKSDLIVVQKYKKILETITGSNTQIVQNTRKDYKVPVWSYFSTNKNNKIFIDKYFDNQCGNKTLSAHIPNFIKQNNLWIPFIAGLVDTDGFCNNTGKLEITLSNYNVISEIAEWIESIGDYCSTSIKIDNRKDTFNDSYIVRIYTYSKIYGLIKKYLCNPKRLEFEGIKQQSLNFELLDNELNSIFNFPAKQLNYDTALYNRFVSNRRTLKKTFTTNLMSLNNYQQAKLFDDTNIAEISSRVKQKSIIPDNDKKQIYYDISVEDNNNYYAGNFGFVNIHNCGLDISSLRPDTAIIHNQAKSSPGPILFAERYSNITKEVAIRGRRGALMISMNIAHPDAEAFALSKQDLTKITGANISLIIDDDFMHAVEFNSPYYQHFPCDVDIDNFEFDSIAFNELVTVPYTNKNGEKLTGYVRKIRAKELWQTIIECAWRTAEPGIMLSGNWKKNGTDWFYDEYRPVSSNPCSEICMQPYDSCRLASINLFGCVDNPFTKDAEFNFDKLYKLSYEQLSILDNIIDLECDYIQAIIDKTNNDKYEPQELKKQVTDLWFKILEQARSGRRTGAGFTALGDTLAALGLKYDSSAETKHFLLKLFQTKIHAELDATTDLAILFGSFKGCDANKEFTGNSGNNAIFKRIAKLFPNIVRKMKRYGRRNVSWSTAAPTGSLSILTQTTSGIEPLFLPWYKRRKKCISDDERVDYIDPADGQKFTEFFVLHPQFAKWLAIENGVDIDFVINTMIKTLTEDELNNWFKISPWYNCCANDIDWKARVEIQSIVQEYTTHSISSTINLPADTKQEIISEIYLQSWKSGLKGNTVYRDGCRGGVLVSTNNKQTSEDDFDESRAPKRPRRLPAKYHTIRSKGKVYSVIIGFYKDKPYEIFIATDDNLPENFEEFEDVIEGELVKDFKDWYNFECEEFLIPDLGDVEHEDKEISLMLSMALRHRTPLKYIIKTLSKTKPLAGSFTYKLIKILSKYIVNGETDGEKCPECGQHLIYENGCRRCPHCGWSKC